MFYAYVNIFKDFFLYFQHNRPLMHQGVPYM